MGNLSSLALALATGLSVGYFYFYGLHWTVRKASSFKRPILLFISSFFIRTACAGCIFYFVGNGDFINYALILLGFIVSRFIFFKVRRIT